MEAVMKDKITGADPTLMLAAAEDCGARFWSQVCICVMVCENLFYEVYDMCEDRKMTGFHYKKPLKACIGSFDELDNWLKENENQILIRDYGTQVQKRIDRQLRDLYITFKIYLERMGQKDTEIKAHILVVTTLIHYSVDLFDGYFNMYKERYGIDMRDDYMPARIEVVAQNFNTFANLVILPERNKLNPIENYASERAFDALCDRLADEKMIDEAGLEVMKLNHMDDAIKQYERERLGVERLKDKYKVSMA